MDDDEIVAVIAHELGHWKKNHTVRLLAFSYAQIFTIFFLFSFFIERTDVFISFGFNWHSKFIAFLLFAKIFGVISFALGRVQNFMVRGIEFEADQFALQLGYKDLMITALIKIHIENAANLNPDWWYAQFHFSHPELVERIRALGYKGQKVILSKRPTKKEVEETAGTEGSAKEETDPLLSKKND